MTVRTRDFKDGTAVVRLTNAKVIQWLNDGQIEGLSIYSE